jgi:hypothetical protein
MQIWTYLLVLIHRYNVWARHKIALTYLQDFLTVIDHKNCTLIFECYHFASYFLKRVNMFSIYIYEDNRTIKSQGRNEIVTKRVWLHITWKAINLKYDKQDQRGSKKNQWQATFSCSLFESRYNETHKTTFLYVFVRSNVIFLSKIGGLTKLWMRTEEWK